MYKVSVHSITDREKIVARLKESSPITNSIIEIGGEEKKINIYNISIDAPLYNMKNFRTSGEQDTYIKENKLPEDFFKKGQENESAQNIQHNFLLEMAKEGSQSLFNEFEAGTAFDKNDPIVVTNKLVVRDGNRRLSVLRDLYQSNKSKYEKYQKIPCAVIFDPTTEKEEELYEVDKQMKLDLKAKYEWYNEALFHRHLTQKHKMDDGLISKRTRAKIADIEKKRFALVLAEKYLKKKKKDKQYKLLKGAEQFWMDYAAMQRSAAKNTKNRDSQFIWKGQQFISEVIAGSAASLKAEGAGRIYAPHRNLCKEENVAKAIGVLADHHNIKVKQDKTKKLLGGYSSQSKAELAALQVKELEKIYGGGKVVDPKKIQGIVEELKAEKDVRYIEKEFSSMSETMALIEGRPIPIERYEKILKIANVVKKKINEYVDKKLSKFNKKK